MSEIREEFNEKLLDHNKIPVPSPQPGDMVFDYYTGSPGWFWRILLQTHPRFYGVIIPNLRVNQVTL
jgi:hypothetical protein